MRNNLLNHKVADNFKYKEFKALYDFSVPLRERKLLSKRKKKLKFIQEESNDNNYISEKKEKLAQNKTCIKSKLNNDNNN